MTERKGALMRYTPECGHGMVVYSLEPTPERCPDCADYSRSILADVVRDIGNVESDLDCSGCPGVDELGEWLDESGVTEQSIRDDILQLAGFVDEARYSLFEAVRRGRKMLERYPKAERLKMPKEKR